MTQGFITVATGSEQYYEMALNLLRSYRFHCAEPLPFAILAEEENRYTREFDDVRVLPTASRSYLDKLELADHLPYDINIFIDADCLAYRDLNGLFDIFADADDVSCFGRVLPLDDKTGWFNYEDLGTLQEKVSYIVGLHGGIYYLRRTEYCRKIFRDAKALAENYEQYHFKGHFKLGDEPLLALSMAVNGCRPSEFVPSVLVCYWEHQGQVRLSMEKKQAYCRRSGTCVDLVHWGTRFTRTLLYRKQIAVLECLRKGKPARLRAFLFDLRLTGEQAMKLVRRVINKLLRILKIK